jgi:hypothetical protein
LEVQTELLRSYVLSPNGWMGGQIFGGMGLRTGGPDSLRHLASDRNNQGLGGRLADARFEPGLLTLVAILHALKSSE